MMPEIGGEAWTLATWPAECFKPPSLQPVDHPLLAAQGWVSNILHCIHIIIIICIFGWYLYVIILNLFDIPLRIIKPPSQLS